jgi:hypothetical protein
MFLSVLIRVLKSPVRFFMNNPGQVNSEGALPQAGMNRAFCSLPCERDSAVVSHPASRIHILDSGDALDYGFVSGVQRLIQA